MEFVQICTLQLKGHGICTQICSLQLKGQWKWSFKTGNFVLLFTKGGLWLGMTGGSSPIS